MNFSFEARTLLELGKELISSDEVALYELIKNAVDAGRPRSKSIFGRGSRIPTIGRQCDSSASPKGRSPK